MIIDERAGSTVVVRKVGGLISGAWLHDADEAAKRDRSRDVRETNLRGGLPAPPPERASSLSECAPGAAPARQRILIVEDDAASAELLATLLQATGRAELQITRLGSEAVALAVEFRATIVLIDLELPDMGGYGLARLLHQHPLLQKLRLIALTDSGEHAARELAREVGFERYIIKPVTHTAVEELL